VIEGRIAHRLATTPTPRTRMPGPGAKKNNQKSKKNVQSNPSGPPMPPTFVADIDNAEDWARIVNLLCETLELPGRFFPWPPSPDVNPMV
jgi:hypothetical protein